MEPDPKIKNNLINNLTIGIVVTNQQGQILFTNRAIKEMTGYTETEIKNLEDWYKKAYPNQEYRKKAKKIFQYDIENNISNRTYRITTAAGDYKYLNFRYSQLGADKQLFEIIDISYRIKQKQELENKKVIFENLFNNALEAIVLLDEDLNILNVNNKFEEIFELSKKDVLNKYALEAVDLAEDAEDIKVGMRLVAAGKEWENEVRFKVENEIKHCNVHIFSVETEKQKKLTYIAVDDITETRKRAKELKEVKERLELAVTGANIGIWDWKSEKKIIHFNKNWIEMLGYEVSKFNNNINSWLDLVHPDDKTAVLKDLKNYLKGETGKYFVEHRLKTRSGKWKWIRAIGKVTERDAAGNPVRMVGVHIDIDDEKRLTNEKEYLSNHDELTGLYNRRYFNEEIKRLYDSRRYPISIIIGDLNKLKDINDNYGHIVGDRYIKAAAEMIKESLRVEDLVARVGGDEFAVILPETDSDTAAAVSKRILENIEEKNKEAALPERLSIALGYETADFNDPNNTFQNVIECYHQADQKMYENKFAQR